MIANTLLLRLNHAYTSVGTRPPTRNTMSLGPPYQSTTFPSSLFTKPLPALAADATATRRPAICLMARATAFTTRRAQNAVAVYRHTMPSPGPLESSRCLRSTTLVGPTHACRATARAGRPSVRTMPVGTMPREMGVIVVRTARATALGTTASNVVMGITKCPMREEAGPWTISYACRVSAA